MPAPTVAAPARARRGHVRRVAPPLRVTLLDSFAVTEDGIEVRLGAAERRLLALVALRQRPLRRTQLAALLWPQLSDRGAAASLRSALSRLRAASPRLLAEDATQVRLSTGVHVDAKELETLAARLADGVALPEDVMPERLTAELLPDWQEDWVVFERNQLRDLCLHALEVEATRLVAARRFAQALLTAREVLRVDPLCESAARVLIEIHLAQGNQARAARSYLDFRQRLRLALGVEPSAELRVLVRPLLVRRAAS